MTETLIDADMRRLRDVLDATRCAEPTPGRIPFAVLDALWKLIRCDDVTFVDMDIESSTQVVANGIREGVYEQSEEPLTEPEAPFWRHYQSSPCSYPTRSGDDCTVTLSSDFHTLRQWHNTPMYREAFSATPYDHEMMCSFPTVGARARRLLFFRFGGADFNERDRLAMTLLRPHLVAAYERQRAAAPLTPRQLELMELVAAGHSNAEIAAKLFVTTSTVRKHLENVFERLNVNSRTAAVARTFHSR